ncbi:MAG: 7TM diverse intracellular signaling domain-containing protein [Gammaproteobacteria bacterium]|nr:7TM diverse intracellular signaling domain-containing protein [Gammaproteobacteria bacterium]MDP2348428.1 7TM diverse intracellular signaling domain-containing protein [Gammaproteobacteria bacterium]
MAHIKSLSGFHTLCLLAVCLLLSALTADVVVAVSLDEFSAEISPGGEMMLAEDVNQAWTLEEAIGNLAARGERWDGPGFPIFGFSSSAWWASLTIDNKFTENQQWLAKMDFASIDQIDFHYQDGNGEWVHKSAGDTLPFTNRDLNHHSIIFTFPVIAGQEQTLYFRVINKGSVQLPISLMSMDHYPVDSRVEYFWVGIYYGMLSIITLYSFFIWVSTADRSYLYYVLFLISGASYSLSFQGFSYQYLWPDNSFWANRSIIVFIALAAAAGMMFVRAFVELKKINATLDKIMSVAVVVALAYAVTGLIFPYEWLSRFLVFFTLSILGLISIAAWMVANSGYRPGNFFVAAWSLLLVGIFLEIIQRLGVNIPPVLSYHAIQFSTSIAVVLLSLGLGDRINSLIKEYSTVQNDVLKANQLKIEALQKADDVKEEFIANVSHELRTPLTGIIGLSEIILENKSGTLEESVRENLAMIKISGQRLANLVNDVIDFSAIKNGHLELHKRPVDLKSICILVNKMCRPMIGNKPIQLAENLPVEPVLVMGDEDRLQQVLFNLVSNAIKFTQRGWVAVSIEIIDIDARVMVKDTGIGISRDQQSRIFNRFYQIDSAASREEGGTGLGLAISQKLVELHGTEIVLRSSPGEGSTFYFDLPLLSEENKTLADKSKSARKLAKESGDKLNEILQTTQPMIERRSRDSVVEHSGSSLPVPGRKRGRILVVDDEYLNVRIVQEHLSGTYDVISALNGNDALVILEEDKPDLVILDLMMPIMTGFELCQRIREQYSMDELPIVILTAKNRVEDLVKGLNMGANDYISKPFSKEELKVRIGKQFEMLNLLEVRQENLHLNWQLQKYEENERKLRARETRLAKMLDVTGDALIAIDESGVIVNVNKAAEELLSVSAQDYQNAPLGTLVELLAGMNAALTDVIGFPFKESVISGADTPTYFNFTLQQFTDDESKNSREIQVRLCILPLSLDQEFYLLMLQRTDNLLPKVEEDEVLQDSLPQLITQINRNVERTQMLGEYLARITPEDLQKHRHLFTDLENVDRIIKSMSGTLLDGGDDEQQYREALVKLMQDCHYYWQKVTGESIIELAEKSRIWSVSIDNGRLRTRSMNRYLSIDKLPSNPRWRQVARTAYFVLSKVSHDPEAKTALEKSVTRLQDIVESKALT